jgi:hypothetical protein
LDTFSVALLTQAPSQVIHVAGSTPSGRVTFSPSSAMISEMHSNFIMALPVAMMKLLRAP